MSPEIAGYIRISPLPKWLILQNRGAVGGEGMAPGGLPIVRIQTEVCTRPDVTALAGRLPPAASRHPELGSLRDAPHWG